MAQSPSPTGVPSRRAKTDAKIAAVVSQQLSQIGYAALTIEGVAAASSVAKTTIYRRWPSKADMVFELALHRPDPGLAPDTGSLTGDVRALAERAVALIAAEPGRQVLPGLLADMAGDARLTERLRTMFGSAARTDIATVLDRAQDRGELRCGVDVDAFHAALLGIPYAEVHLLGRNDKHMIERLTDQLLSLVRRPSS